MERQPEKAGQPEIEEHLNAGGDVPEYLATYLEVWVFGESSEETESQRADGSEYSQCLEYLVGRWSTTRPLLLFGLNGHGHGRRV